jgi:hypothetical protein
MKLTTKSLTGPQPGELNHHFPKNRDKVLPNTYQEKLINADALNNIEKRPLYVLNYSSLIPLRDYNLPAAICRQ